METVVLKIGETGADEAKLQLAAQYIRDGKLVILPTETVYGLGANALDFAAVRGIFAAKGRPADNPLIVHIADFSQIEPLVKTIPPELELLAKRFWPGALTVILPKTDLVPNVTSGSLDTVAIRMPDHSAMLEVIRRAGVPVAAPSANRSGFPSPTSAQHCIDDMDGRVDMIVDGGACAVGVESTVLTLCTNPPKILRPGAVTLEMLKEVLPNVTYDEGAFAHLPDDAKAASPGMKYRHYAPKAQVILVHGSAQQLRDYIADKPGAGVLCFEGEEALFAAVPHITYGAGNDPASQARQLFDALRRIDTKNVHTVYVRMASAEGLGQAVYNRLLRAAAFLELTL